MTLKTIKHEEFRDAMIGSVFLHVLEPFLHVEGEQWILVEKRLLGRLGRHCSEFGASDWSDGTWVSCEMVVRAIARGRYPYLAESEEKTMGWISSA